MSDKQPHEGTEWTPATSEPGELYTVEGRSRATWAFLAGAKNKDPRLRSYRKQMRRTGIMMVGLLAAVIALVAIVVAIVG